MLLRFGRRVAAIALEADVARRQHDAEGDVTALRWRCLQLREAFGLPVGGWRPVGSGDITHLEVHVHKKCGSSILRRKRAALAAFSSTMSSCFCGCQQKLVEDVLHEG